MKRTIFLLFLLIPLFGIAQQRILQKKLDKYNVVNFMAFNLENYFVPIENARQLLHDSLNLSSDDNLVLIQEKKGGVKSFTRQTYEQYYKGIKVEDGLYGVHGRNGKIEYIGGEFKKVGKIPITPSFSEKKAFDNLLNYINAKKYRWQIPFQESELKINKKDSTATYYPKGELLICKDVINGDSLYRLAYKFDIFAVDPVSHKLYYVDAITGDVVNIKNMIFNSNSPATGTTLYSGTVPITTDSYGNPVNYRLYETRSSHNTVIHTYNANHNVWNYNNNPPTMPGISEFSNTSTTWPSNAAIDAHWGVEKVFDYWLSRGRVSLDNKGLSINGYVHYGQLEPVADQAGWDGYEMNYGDGGTYFNTVVSLDVVAHETGHGITQYTALLNGGGESLSLNEGFSDIWGAVIENWAAPNDGNKNTWLMGEEIMKNGKLCLRSLRSPKTEGYNIWTGFYPGGYPDTYLGTYWIDPSGCVIGTSDNDNCYSHTDMTVLSHWFYLLSQGGSSTNDLHNNYTVYGVGINNAANIAWFAEDSLLKNYHNANYSDAMTQTIQAATDLYGANSLTVMQVRNAWYAVGLGARPSQIQCPISGNFVVCSSPGSQYTVGSVPSGYTVSWTGSSTLTLPQNTNVNPITVTANGYGPAWLHACLISANGETVYLPVTMLWAGKFEGTAVTGQAQVCPNSIYTYTAQVPGGHSPSYSYSWTYPSNWMYPYQYQNTIRLQTPQYNMQYGTVRVSITNSCGTSGYSGITVYPGSCPHNLILSPNPASDVVNVNVIPSQSQVSDSSITMSSVQSANTSKIVYKVTITDLMGTSYYNATKNTDSFTLPVQSLPNGNYIITVDDGVNKGSAQLVVKH
jgi:bacillolysin